MYKLKWYVFATNFENFVQLSYVIKSFNLGSYFIVQKIPRGDKNSLQLQTI